MSETRPNQDNDAWFLNIESLCKASGMNYAQTRIVENLVLQVKLQEVRDMIRAVKEQGTGYKSPDDTPTAGWDDACDSMIEKLETKFSKILATRKMPGVF